MIPFDEMDRRLDALGLTRSWLAAKSGRSPHSIRAALAPNATPKNRSELLQRALSAAIEREEADRAMFAQPAPPGMTNLLLNDDMLDRADRASRLVNAPSLAEFCRDAILFRATEILKGNDDPLNLPFTPAPAKGAVSYPPRRQLKVAEQPPTPSPKNKRAN